MVKNHISAMNALQNTTIQELFTDTNKLMTTNPISNVMFVKRFSKQMSAFTIIRYHIWKEPSNVYYDI